MPGGHRGLCLFAPLVAGAQGARAHGPADAAGLREALRQTAAEFGIVAPVGRKGVEALFDIVANPTDKRVPGDSACVSRSTWGSTVQAQGADS